MFIARVAERPALRRRAMLQGSEPTLGGHPGTWINMALLAEGQCYLILTINMALLTEGHVRQAAACRTSGVSRQKLTSQGLRP